MPWLSASSARRIVSNPISGEVGAAATVKPVSTYGSILAFQTPSAVRWVLQLLECVLLWVSPAASFKPHQRGGGCCSLDITAVKVAERL